MPKEKKVRRKRVQFIVNRNCRFCADKVDYIDYKDMIGFRKYE
jgi:ribosomal protein S18